MDSESLQKHAYTGSVKFAGSVLVLSIAFNQVGLNFRPVMDALTLLISSKIEQQAQPEVINKRIAELENDILELKRWSHPEKGSSNE